MRAAVRLCVVVRGPEVKSQKKTPLLVRQSTL
jgi:hypothetical protein